MAEQPPAAPAEGAAAAASAPKPGAPSLAAGYKAPQPTPMAMMGLPGLPKKLPSRNWMIFWTVVGTLSTAIIYDKREKKRATAKWAKTVAHLAKEPIPNHYQMPRKLTIFLESPPADGLIVTQEHYIEYVKPILAASGLDWEFVQGRKEGDIRGALAERIRRLREPRVIDGEPTKEEIIQEVRAKQGIPEYDGVRGDIVIGRHTWKEYVRGLHEGWLGPVTAPVVAEPPKEFVEDPKPVADGEASPAESESKPEEKPEEEKEKKPERPPQPKPYNTTSDYSTSDVPLTIPNEFSPAAPIQFPHQLGFTNTPARFVRFLNRRKLADDIGREVAAVCLAASREFKNDVDGSETQAALEHEEKNWSKKVFQEDKSVDNGAGPDGEKIWASPVVLDSRIASRMRRFELRPEDEERARQIVVPEEEIEGWIKGSLRGLYRWATTPTPLHDRYSLDSEFS